MDGITFMAILFGLSVWFILRVITQSPIGYEDETGFHIGIQPCDGAENEKG